MAISRRQLLALTGAAVVATAVDVGAPDLAAADGVVGLPPPPPDGRGPAEFTTLRKTVLVGQPDPSTGYATLVAGPGERHIPRNDLGGFPYNPTYFIAAFAQMTDLHITDDQSPLRVEFLDKYANPGPPHFASYETAKSYRAHESMSTQVVDAMCRAIRMVGHGPRTNLPLAFTIMTGDAIDNAQYNETRWYIDLLDGQKYITPNSGHPTLDHSVSSDALGLEVDYWHARNRDDELDDVHRGGPGLDRYFQAGFPSIVNMPYAARHTFWAIGLGMPWFAAFGNHDILVQGNVLTDSGLVNFVEDMPAFAVGTFKPSAILGVPDVMPDNVLDWVGLGVAGLFHDMSGIVVPADPNRRLLTKQEFLNEHFVNTSPGGHGLPFDGNGRAYYVMNPNTDELIRHIVLDTPNAERGGAGGRIDGTQFAWLKTQLISNSSRYINDNGDITYQPNVTDRLIIIYSHHTLDSMKDSFLVVSDAKSGAALKDLLLRFPNVILHVNGHNHKNSIKPWARDPWMEISGGFWEVSTASHIDWPIQSRIFEVAAGRGTISIFTTMVDIDAPLSYNNDISNPRSLAGLARELAANDIQERGPHAAGRRGIDPATRNTQLMLPAPFPLPGGRAYGLGIAVAANADGRLEVFGVGADDKVYHRVQVAVAGNAPTWTGSTWVAFDVGGIRCIAAASNTNGIIELWGVNQLGWVYRRFQVAANTWAGSSWVQYDGTLSSIALGRNANGTLELFGTDYNDQTYHRTQSSPGNWTGSVWQSMDGGLAQVSPARHPNGRITLFGVTNAGAVYHRTQSSPGDWTGSTWAPFAKATLDVYAIFGPVTSVTATSGSTGLLVYTTSGDGLVRCYAQTGPNADVWVGLDTSIDGSVTQLAANFAGGVELFGVDQFGFVLHRTSDVNNPPISWSSWAFFDKQLRPALAPHASPRITSRGQRGATVGTPVDVTLPMTGGTAPYRWWFGGLPTGLTYNWQTGRITGTPTAAGWFSVEAYVDDLTGAFDDFVAQWQVVNPPPPSVTVPDVAGFTQAQAGTAIRAAGLVVGKTSKVNNCVDPGTVQSQNPAANTSAPQGSSVNITVSTCEGGGSPK